jgi:activator of HSP90 ATPase
MLENIEISILLPLSAERIYKAWLDSDEHGAFTGGEGEIEPFECGRYTAWDGYIEGITLSLEPYYRIVQSWRSAEFLEDDQDSRLEIVLEERGEQTQLTLIHTNIPMGQGEKYKSGWVESYFDPMEEYFS